MKATGVILILGLLTRAFTAPVDINIDKKSGPRVSTKEILNLEQQLKAQAGEDKKFYPSEMKSKHVPPPQQIDGLEDHHEVDHLMDKAEEPIDHQEEPQPQEDHGDEQLNEPVPSQLDVTDLADLDELKAAEKRHQKVDLATMKGHNGDYAQDQQQPYSSKGIGVNDEEGEEQEEADEMREGDEALFMQSVIDALRDRPQLLQQFLQAGRLDGAEPEYGSNGGAAVPEDEDNADRADVIRAEYLEAMGRQAAAEPWGQDGPRFHQGQAYIPSEALQRDEDELLKPRLHVDAIHQLDGGVADSSDELEEEALARRKYLENYQNYQGDKMARVVKKGYNPFATKRRSDMDEASDESSSEKSSEESKSSESKSDSSESMEDSEELELERKRVDMSQHLAM